jgi:predicted TIM-barrel fold metal-dependent hydrolase
LNHGTPNPTAIRREWLARRNEAPVFPEIAIIDAHHHLWDPPGARYLFDEYLSDVQSGHRVEASVFIECNGMLRSAGPEEFRPVGETEFAAGIAAQSDSGLYGPAQLCAAIVGFADLTTGGPH